MAVHITEECIACGVCEPECPRGCIKPGDIYVIDYDCCEECYEEGTGPACVKVCPVDCMPYLDDFEKSKVDVNKVLEIATKKYKEGKIDPMIDRLKDKIGVPDYKLPPRQAK